MKNDKQMNFKILFLASATLMSASLTWAQEEEEQNRVPNPSFEQVDGKIRRMGGIEEVENWTSPTGAQADIFTPKMNNEGPGSPNNEYGKENPADGSNYAGIVFFSYNDKEPRSYLSVKMKESLKKDLNYCIKFKISLAEAAAYACNNIGVNLSRRKFNYDEPRTIIDDIHVKDLNNKIFNARFNWDQICGVHHAKGGEKFLTIGNFKSNGDTEYERMRRDPKSRVRQIYSAYYYVDDISVTVVDKRRDCACEDKKSMGSEIIYSKSIARNEDMTQEDFIKESNVYFAYGKNEIEVGGQETMDSIALILKENPSYQLKIIGHQDPIETKGAQTDGSMRGMSNKRARKVFYYLKNKGIDDSRLEQVDQSDSQVADKLDNKIAHAKNRRVEFELIKKEDK